MKHSKICKKVFFGKRKAFDSKKKRIIDSEHAMTLKYSKFDQKMTQNSKKRDWKQESENFRMGLKEARNYEVKINNPKSSYGTSSKIIKNTFPKSGMGMSSTSSYSKSGSGVKLCYYCNRNVNTNGYLKHVSLCEYRDQGLNLKQLYPGSKKSKFNQKVSTQSNEPKLYTNSNSSNNKNYMSNNKLDSNKSSNLNYMQTGKINSMTDSLPSSSSNNKYKIVNSNVSSFKI